MENTIRTKQFTSTSTFDESDNTLIAKISSDSPDRYNEIVTAKGGDFTAFQKNPVVLLNHDSKGLPIAKALWIKSNDNNIISKLKFAETALGQEVAKLYKDGFMSAFSIGFLPKEIEINESEQLVYKNWELLEYSAVTVPANSESLALAYKSVKTPELKEIFEKEIEKNEQKEKVIKFEQKLQEFENNYTPGERKKVWHMNGNLIRVPTQTKRQKNFSPM